ncbi:MAG: nitroreductase family protein [Candidatus Omnitrophica bacterium]|nr:nitroreductase family protein [Candidatus Omnitrophota bacterium]
MELLRLIKSKQCVREYKKKRIPHNILSKIIEAGIWGPAVHHYQPWKFFAITNKKTIVEIAQLLLRADSSTKTVSNLLEYSASNIIRSAAAIIIVYNSGDMHAMRHRLKQLYLKFERILDIVELSAIAAAIQNMMLVAESFGVGSCWLDTPLLQAQKINKLLRHKGKMVAVITLGYASQRNTRSLRKPIKDSVNYIK